MTTHTFEIGDVVRRKSTASNSYTVGHDWFTIKSINYNWATDRHSQAHDTANLELKPADKPTTDLVNHPGHYKRGGIEAIDVSEAYELDLYDFNTIKYTLRAKFKGAELQDLRKARWYLDRKIARLEAKANK